MAKAWKRQEGESTRAAWPAGAAGGSGGSLFNSTRHGGMFESEDSTHSMKGGQRGPKMGLRSLLQQAASLAAGDMQRRFDCTATVWSPGLSCRCHHMLTLPQQGWGQEQQPQRYPPQAPLLPQEQARGRPRQRHRRAQQRCGERWRRPCLPGSIRGGGRCRCCRWPQPPLYQGMQS